MKNSTKNIKEVKIVKKVIMTLFFVALSVVLVYGIADAVSGPCSSCHTMHNSQDGAPDNYDSSATPNGKLLKGDCLGCHAMDTADNIETLDTIPQVQHTDTNDLAGGNFGYTDLLANQANGHNVSGIGVQDTTHLNVPPGYVAAYDPAATDFDTGSRLVCAGQNGCHGDRDLADEFAAVSGAHHGDDSILKYGAAFTLTGQGADVTTSFRFLNGVLGAEDSDWQDTVNATDHNGYYAKIYAARTTQATTETTSELCGSCHGAFHMSGLTADNGIGTAVRG